MNDEWKPRYKYPRLNSMILRYGLPAAKLSVTLVRTIPVGVIEHDRTYSCAPVDVVRGMTIDDWYLISEYARVRVAAAACGHVASMPATR
jgi:hypothetical protein